MRLDDDGEWLKCDRCKKVHHYTDGGKNIQWNLWAFEIFHRRPKKDIQEHDFCKKCAIEITPIVRQLRDVDELKRVVNKLRKVINI